MSEPNKRSTIYFEPGLHQALRLKAAQSNRSTRPDVKRILATIEQLANDPRPSGCEKLSAQERYRVCQGRYRILYEIEDQHLIITVVKVAHRKHVYRR